MIPSENNPFAVVEEEPTIDLYQYVTLFRQWWWLIVLAMLLGAASGFLVSKQMTPIYQSSTTLLINEAPSDRAADYTSILTSERLAKTYAQMITKRPVLEKVSALLGSPLPPEELIQMVKVTPVRDTQLITLTVESKDPALSAALANAMAIIFSRQLEETQSSRYAESKESLAAQMTDTEKQIADLRQALNSAESTDESARLEARLNQYEQIYSNLLVSFENVRLAEASSTSNVVQVERAVMEAAPVKPRTMQNTALAAMMGLMLAVGGIFAYDLLDDTIKNPEDISRKLKLPVIGTIAKFSLPEDGSLITQAQVRSPEAESFRALRTKVQYTSVDSPLRSLLVTSPTPGDGKTLTAANLAVVMAQGGLQVTLIDADMHRPRIHRVFNVDFRPGLSDLFVEPKLAMNNTRFLTNQDRLKAISAGKLPPNQSELLGSNKMREILRLVGESSDMVLFDTPPVLSVTDAVVLAPLVDGVLLVARQGVTKLSQLRLAAEQLQYVGANLVGVVVNGIDKRNSRYGYYYRSYYYEADGNEGREPKRNQRKISSLWSVNSIGKTKAHKQETKTRKIEQ